MSTLVNKLTIIILTIFLVISLFYCHNTMEGSVKINALVTDAVDQDSHTIENEKNTVEGRFFPPHGFERTIVEENSFGSYLRKLPLKKAGAQVNYYNGESKPNYNVYEAVVDLPIGNKNLHQCADAVMRLWASYLYSIKEYDKIHFNFTNGFRVDYTKCMKGYRVAVNGNNCSWVKSKAPSNTSADFWNYLELIFTYAGTLSLSKELESINMDDLKIGDVFIIGGSPGHAVIVVDVAVNNSTNEKVFMLAQSYMPAQELQILKNGESTKLNPWYSDDFEDKLITPEYIFGRLNLKRFKVE